MTTPLLAEPDFQAHMESENGRHFVKRLKAWCEKNGMNYMKFLCLRWQSKTNKKCTNRKHAQGVYSKELECEAQLVECLTIQMDFSSIMPDQEDEVFEQLEKQLEKGSLCRK